jgi:hypothetical protein
MSKADEYRAKGLQFMAEAEVETDPIRRADLEWLAGSYRRLADHADDVFGSNIVEFTPKRQVPQAQQQQQQSSLDGKPTPEAE